MKNIFYKITEMCIRDRMKKYHIPTAAYENFDDADEAIHYLDRKSVV